MWVIVTVLASCQNAPEDLGLSEPVAESSGYPSLHTVPPRPQLSYTIEQRRAVIDGLIADRENARYSNQVVRYRTGLSGLPPPDAPPVGAAPATIVPGDSAAAEVLPAPGAVRGRPIVDPETESIYEDDDDLDSFLEGLAGGRTERPVEVAPGPGSDAAPLARTIARAGGVRPVGPPAAAHDGPPPGVVWGIPVETAGLPQAPRPQAAAASGNHAAKVPPPPLASAMSGRAPGVVWGMVDRSAGPAGPAGISVAQAADGRTEAAPASAVARVPDAAGSTETAHGIGQHLEPRETAMAGRAPGVVWGMVEVPDRSPGKSAAASGVQVADTAGAAAAAPVPPTRAAATPIQTNGQNGTSDRNENSAEPGVAVVAAHPEDAAPSKQDAAATGVEVGDGLIAVTPVSSSDPARTAETIAFTPGSASLPPDAAARLERFLAEVKAPDARIRVVGEADAPDLALRRAAAVGVALVRRGVPAHRLELTLAQDAAGDQARLSLAPSAH